MLDCLGMIKRITQIVSGDLWGGAEAQVLCQSKALQDAGYKLEIVSFNEKEPAVRYKKAGLACIVVDESMGLIYLITTLLKHLRSSSPDILIAHGYKECVVAALLSLVTKTPWISTFHGLGENYRGWKCFKMAIYAAIQKQLSIYLSTHLICVSADLSRRLSLDRLSKLSIVHNAVDLDSEKAVEDIFPKKPAIVSAGRLAPIKRLDRALRVFRKVNLLRKADGLAPSHFYIMGEGPEESVLRELSEQLGISAFVNFVGFRQDAPELLSCADLVILSSDSEGIPTVVLEALSSGVPVAATDVGGLKEVQQVVTSPLFVLCPQDDEEQFAISLSSLLKQHFSDRDKEQVRKAVKEHFSPASAVRKLEAIFELL